MVANVTRIKSGTKVIVGVRAKIRKNIMSAKTPTSSSKNGKWLG